MWVLIGMLGLILWTPGVVLGAACTEFPWQHSPDMKMPSLIALGREAKDAGHFQEAHHYFSTYLQKQTEGMFSEGARFLLAALPDPGDERGKEVLNQIERLQSLRTQQPNSPYAPWALCEIGNLYWSLGWYSEANGVFEEFLKTYPDHPLGGGVMIEAGRGYLANDQYLEAALIFRRVIEEPKWEAHRVQGALGLATATALSKGWEQASYWYHVVEAERPELLRGSSQALFYYGETELATGEASRARARFLTTINLHPRASESGMAFIRLSQEMFKARKEYLGLWFAEQASQRFRGYEAGRRGKAGLIRWVVSFLNEPHTKEDWVRVYQRLDDLEVYLSISWDSVLEHARTLSQAPEPDLAEESLLWMAHGYEQVGDRDGAINAFAHLTTNATSSILREKGTAGLRDILYHTLEDYKRQGSWVALLKFHADHRQAFNLLPLERDRVLTIAEAYQAVALPQQAITWYDRFLKENAAAPFREEILLRKVALADELKASEYIQEFGGDYLRDFPNGKWQGVVATLMGLDSMTNQRYELAVGQFTHGVEQTEDEEARRYALRSRARAYLSMGNIAQCQKDYEDLVSGKSPHISDVLGLGDVLFEQGKFELAVPLYRQVRNHQPSDELTTWASYRLGLAFERLGQDSEAGALLNDVRSSEAKPPDFEHSIRVAAGAALEEFSLHPKHPGENADTPSKL